MTSGYATAVRCVVATIALTVASVAALTSRQSTARTVASVYRPTLAEQAAAKSFLIYALQRSARPQ